MPMTHYQCPDCGGCLHTDDLLEGECVTPACGYDLGPHWDGQWNLPREGP